jgi:DNA invertase Pin-like site-specific DNA recombinase
VALIGYARVSSTDQSLAIQLEQLRAAGCERIFKEQRSGTTTDKREALAECLEFVREGDVLMITRLDRLARSLQDLVAIGKTLADKRVELRALSQPVDTTTPAGRLFYNMLGAIAEFETDLRRERQAEGIAAAKAKGIYKGSKAKVTREMVEEQRRKGVTAAVDIARALKCSRRSVYRACPDGWGAAPIGG